MTPSESGRCGGEGWADEDTKEGEKLELGAGDERVVHTKRRKPKKRPAGTVYFFLSLMRKMAMVSARLPAAPKTGPTGKPMLAISRPKSFSPLIAMP